MPSPQAPIYVLSIFPAIGDHSSPAKSPRPLQSFHECRRLAACSCFSHMRPAREDHLPSHASILISMFMFLVITYFGLFRPGSWIVLTILRQFTPTH